MKRLTFSFRPNMADPRNQEAWGFLSAVPKGQKNQYLVQAILQMEASSHLEDILRRVIREEVKDVSCKAGKTEETSEIPNAMFQFLSSLEKM